MLHSAVMLIAATLAAAPAAPDTVVVCPGVFRTALAPWVQYRSQQGHTMVLVAAELAPQEIRQQICKAAEGKRLQYVVLVGDADPALQRDPNVRRRCVPTHRIPAKVNIAWGSEPEIATDNGYADLDDDQVPDLAIGRLTADSPHELAAMVRKTLAYEQSTDLGLWRRQMNLVASVGNFGSLADTLIESAAKYVIGRGVPDEYRLAVTYGNWRSPYCPDPLWFHETALETLNDGPWMWIFAGHGHWLWLPGAQTPTGWTATLTIRDEARLRAVRGPSVALLLACYAGRYDMTEDCLAETLLRAPGGPVAVVAGSRMTMPYGMCLLSSELMHQCFREHCPTLGAAMLAAKRRMIKEGAHDRELRNLLDTLALAVNPAGDKLAQERLEHVCMMNLLGDPLLRIRYGKEIVLPSGVGAPGTPLVVRGTSPVAGHCTVELVSPLGELPFAAPSRRAYPATDAERGALQTAYGLANDGRLSAAEGDVEKGDFEIRLDVPAEARGRRVLRAYVEGSDDFALGSAPVEIRAAEGNKEPSWAVAAEKRESSSLQR